MSDSGPRLICSDEATLAKTQPTKPCTDCPFARASLPGWLGGIPIQDWLAAVHSDSLMVCHVHPNVQCAGAAIYRRNVCKLLQDPSLLVLPADRQLVFATPMEFTKHHSNPGVPDA